MLSQCATLGIRGLPVLRTIAVKRQQHNLVVHFNIQRMSDTQHYARHTQDIHVAENPILGATAAPLATGAIALAPTLSNLSSEELGRQMLQQFLDAPIPHNATQAKVGAYLIRRSTALRYNSTRTLTEALLILMQQLMTFSSRRQYLVMLFCCVLLHHHTSILIPILIVILCVKQAWEAAEGAGTMTLQLLSGRNAPAAQLRATVRLQHSVAAMVPLLERLQTLEAEAHSTAVALAEAREVAASAAAAAASAATAAASAAAARSPASARVAAAASSGVHATREPSQRLSYADDLAEEDVQPLGSVHLLGSKSPGALQHGTGGSTQGRYTRQPAGGGIADSMVGGTVPASAYDDGASTDSEDCEEGVVFAADPVNLQTIVYGEDEGPEPEDSFLLAAAASLPQPLQ